jgi:glutaredoxin-related protein
LNEQNQNILSIRLSIDKFKYTTFDPFQENIATIADWELNPSLSLTANLKKFLHEEDDFNNYKQVNVMLESSRYITVPIELFDDEQTELLFYHNITKHENEIILYNILQSINSVVIYSLDTSAHHLLITKYPEVKFYVHVSPLLEYFSAKSHQGNNRKMYVNLRNEAIDIFCLDHGRLLLANSYDCREIADRIYYILYIWKQLNLDQERDEILFYGNMPEKDMLIAQADKYIRHHYILNQSVEATIKSLCKCV